jgi:hypothetical protein
MGISSCAITRWSSDTAVTCTQRPSLGRIRNFALTLQTSVVATFSTSFVFSPETDFVGNGTSSGAITAALLVTVVGTGFGMWDSSLRLRLSSSYSSSADATLWTCNTHIAAKVFVFHRTEPGVMISLSSIVHNISSVQVPERRPPTILSSATTNFPSTGAALVLATGAYFGLYSTSMRASIASTGCESSSWVSDSFLRCKSSAGLSQLDFDVTRNNFRRNIRKKQRCSSVL